jgi:hypothetical protein
MINAMFEAFLAFGNSDHIRHKSSENKGCAKVEEETIIFNMQLRLSLYSGIEP